MEAGPISLLFGIESRLLRIETLTRLRWLALFGQLTTVLGVAFGFGFQLPLRWCLAVIGASVALNVIVELFFRKHLRIDDRMGTLLLSFDVIQLSFLLFFVGGLDNPFSILLLAPVTIASVSLRSYQIVAIVGLVALSASLLSVFHWPLPWYSEQSFLLPQLYRFGLWAALLVAAAFIGAYAAQVAQEARSLNLALTAAELALERQNHLSRLDGLAAAAAHELGTPLATIALVSRELSRAKLPDDFHDDVELLNEQAQRCRVILGRLSSLASEEHPQLDNLKLSYWIETLVSPFRKNPVSIEIRRSNSENEPVIASNPALTYGIGNFIENGVDFARNKVIIGCYWTKESITISISDDGPGFPNEILMQIGEPYLKTKSNRRLKTGSVSGLGLGIFIAKTLLERTMAELSFSNNSGSGAIIEVMWDRKSLELNT